MTSVRKEDASADRNGRGRRRFARRLLDLRVFPLRSAVAALLAAALAGCAIEQQLVFDRPAPAAEAAPTGPVVARDLPPPGAGTPPAEAGLPPIAQPPGSSILAEDPPIGPSGSAPSVASAPLPGSPPSATNGPAPGSALPPILSTQAPGMQAALPPNGPLPPANVETPPPRIAPGAQPAGIGGLWTLSAGGQTCAMNLQEPPSSRTGWSQPGPDCGAFRETASWTLTGSHLFLYDRNTRPLARLAAVSVNRFEGTDTTGAPVSLSR